MGWRTIVISKPSKISLNKHNFLYSPNEDKSITVPIVDISVIILETHQVTITSALLSKLASLNILVFTCDKKHTPNGVFLPFHQHSRFSLMIHKQINWTQAFKKRLWSKIIVQKIKNQAITLKYISKREESKELINLSNQVKSGDSTNIESYSAKLYFSYLFDNFMRRDVSDWKNSALNYGYSIIRGVISRDISSSGFVPSLGLHHKNQLNAFNLSDDMIEPYRAFVDYCVYKIYIDEKLGKYEELTFEHKIKLIELLNYKININNEHTTLLNSINIFINSLVNCTKENNYDLILLPKFSNERI
jgi:CRISPR-associated protein Cas1